MQFSWSTFALQAVNFLVLVWLLNRFLLRPVQAVIEQRRKLSEAARLAAEKLVRETEAKKHGYEVALAAIDSEHQKALDAARTAGEAERQKLLAAARTEAASEITKAHDSIQNERADAVIQTRQEVADLAVRMAGILLGDLAGSIPNDVVLDRLVAELDHINSTERQRWASELAADGATARVVTARILTPDEQAKWKTKLAAVLGQPFNPVFSIDAALLAGARLQLPHTVVNATWADQLVAARNSLTRRTVDRPA